MDKNTYLTANQVAKILHCSPSTLANKRSLRIGLPFLKVGGHKVLYKTEDVIAYTEMQKQHTGV